MGLFHHGGRMSGSRLGKGPAPVAETNFGLMGPPSAPPAPVVDTVAPASPATIAAQDPPADPGESHRTERRNTPSLFKNNTAAPAAKRRRRHWWNP